MFNCRLVAVLMAVAATAGCSPTTGGTQGGDKPPLACTSAALAATFAAARPTPSPYFWQNFSKTQKVEPLYLLAPNDAAQLVEVIACATAAGKRVRMTGSGHSHSNAAINEDVLLTPEKLNQPLALDRTRLKNSADPLLARVQGGIRIRELNDFLDAQGLALLNMGGYDGQTIAGATMTATHGSGLGFGPMSDQIVSVQVVGEGGRVHQIEPAQGITNAATFPGTLEEDGKIPVDLIQNDDVFNAMRVSVGSMGVTYSITLRTDHKFWMREVRFKTTWSKLKAPGGYLQQVLENKPVYTDRPSPEHIEFQYTPYAKDGDHSFLVTERYRSYTPLPEQPQSERGTIGTEFVSGLITQFELPLVLLLNTFPDLAQSILEQALDSQVDDDFTEVSYRVFNIGVVNYTDAVAVEVALDIKDAVAAVERTFAIADQIFKNQRTPHTGPISIRFVKASDGLIATQNGRDTMFIEIIMLLGVNGMEDLLLTYERTLIDEFGGRPHWGLDFNVLKGSQDLKHLYPRWEDWYGQYRAFNKGTFDGKITDRLGISVKPR